MRTKVGQFDGMRTTPNIMCIVIYKVSNIYWFFDYVVEVQNSIDQTIGGVYYLDHPLENSSLNDYPNLTMTQKLYKLIQYSMRQLLLIYNKETEIPTSMIHLPYIRFCEKWKQFKMFYLDIVGIYIEREKCEN